MKRTGDTVAYEIQVNTYFSFRLYVSVTIILIQTWLTIYSLYHFINNMGLGKCISVKEKMIVKKEKKFRGNFIISYFYKHLFVLHFPFIVQKGSCTINLSAYNNTNLVYTLYVTLQKKLNKKLKNRSVSINQSNGA